jgi:hypothetical protein
VCSFSLTRSYFAELTEHLLDKNLQVELMQDSPAMGCLVRVRVTKLEWKALVEPMMGTASLVVTAREEALALSRSGALGRAEAIGR